MIRKFNFIYKGNLINVYAESLDEAEIISKIVFEELDKLQEIEEEKEKNKLRKNKLIDADN